MRFIDREEVARLYADPMTREARWAGVLEVLNFAENHVRRSAQPSLHAFLEELGEAFAEAFELGGVGALQVGEDFRREARDFVEDDAGFGGES